MPEEKKFVKKKAVEPVKQAQAVPAPLAQDSVLPPQVQPGEKQAAGVQKLTAKDVTRSLLKMVEQHFPNLPKDLKRVDMHMDATAFISRAIVFGVVVALILGLALGMIAVTFGVPLVYALLLVPIAFMGAFLWTMQYPRLKIKRKENELDRDILFAGRDMLISLKSGVPLFNAMVNVSKNYGVASVEFSRIVGRVQSGVPAEVALQEASDMNTSRPFRQILLQIITSLRSGSDVALALEIVLSQISQEQVIALKRYGQKLNPISMFYMMLGIIIPSLGIAIGIILTSFINMQVDFGSLLILLLVLAVDQYTFFTLMQSARPNFEV